MGIYEFNANMETMVSKSEFQEFATIQFGGTLGSLVIKPLAGKIFDDYIKKYNDGVNEPVQILSLLEYTVNENPIGSALPGEFKDNINNYVYLYNLIHSKCAYEDFIDVINVAVLTLTGEVRDFDSFDDLIQQVYIMYFYNQGIITDEEISGYEFIQFLNDKIVINQVVDEMISDDVKLKLIDCKTIYNFISDDNTYLYSDMCDVIIELQDDIGYFDVSFVITEDIIKEIYILYMKENIQ